MSAKRSKTLSSIQAVGFGACSPDVFNAKPLKRFLCGEEMRLYSLAAGH